MADHASARTAFGEHEISIIILLDPRTDIYRVAQYRDGAIKEPNKNAGRELTSIAAEFSSFEALVDAINAIKVKEQIDPEEVLLCADANLSDPNEPYVTQLFEDFVDRLAPTRLVAFSNTYGCRAEASIYISNNADRFVAEVVKGEKDCLIRAVQSVREKTTAREFVHPPSVVDSEEVADAPLAIADDKLPNREVTYPSNQTDTTQQDSLLLCDTEAEATIRDKAFDDKSLPPMVESCFPCSLFSRCMWEKKWNASRVDIAPEVVSDTIILSEGQSTSVRSAK